MSRATADFFVSAGEFSGDLIGAELVHVIREQKLRLSSFGVVGPAMIQAGVEEVAHINDFNVMGIWEVAKNISTLRLLEQRILETVDRYQPKFAVLIDFPGFHIRLAEQLKLRGIKVFQYVAPKIWAWGASRATKLRQIFDAVLGILPFEEEFYHRYHINYQYVGSPIKDRMNKVMVSRSTFGIADDKKVVLFLPGSRFEEIHRTLPVMMETLGILRAQDPELIAMVPVARSISWEQIKHTLPIEFAKFNALDRQANDGAEIYDVAGMKFVRGMSYELMALSDAAVITSGTATLECALVETPMLVLYMMNELSYWIAKKVVNIPHISLVNLIANKEVVKEFIQNFSPHQIAEEVTKLLSDQKTRDTQINAFRDIRNHLKGDAARNAATFILKQVYPGG